MSQAVYLTNFTDNGSSEEVSWKGGKGTLAAKGTFGGGTVTLQVQVDGTQGYVEIVDSAISSEDMLSFELPRGCLVKAVLAGATSPDLNVTIGKSIW